VLPVSYYEEVLALQREALGGIDYTNHAATNLFRVRPDLLAFWDRERFVLAVSYDGARGARVTLAGKDANAVVEANLRRLLATPRIVGVNSVLNASNLPHLIEIYDRLRDLVRNSPGTLYWNLIPVHSTAADHPRTAPFQLDRAAAVSGLLELFSHWLDDPQPISVSPLQQHYLAAVRKLLGAPQRSFQRREFGEASLMVNTDGYLYLFRDAYDRAKSLGCLFERPLWDLVEEPAYAASLERTEQETAGLCGGCMYDGQCNHAALIQGHSERSGDRCGLTYALLQAIEAEVHDRGIIGLVRHADPQSVPNHRFLFQTAA
jgi:sulfatase maturation enzyme AslB (radical SAM superfamily)